MRQKEKLKKERFLEESLKQSKDNIQILIFIFNEQKVLIVQVCSILK